MRAGDRLRGGGWAGGDQSRRGGDRADRRRDLYAFIDPDRMVALRAAAAMAAVLAAMLALWTLVIPPSAILPLALGIFVIAWIGQFVGHHIEGRKPSFFDDLRYLLVGPLFVMHEMLPGRRQT
jgi:uncharacterized membrane protein YGL010W